MDHKQEVGVRMDHKQEVGRVDQEVGVRVINRKLV